MMQNKLVENWLINANELSFTTPFVQLLRSEGYNVIQSRGGVIEQGKDVIAYNPEGELCCFQLKCGDIGSAEWQKIRGQISDLVEIPPRNPAIPKIPSEWHCYLVTNGEIIGTTVRTIKDASEAKVSKGYMPINSITKDTLIKRFSNGFGHFFPTEPDDIRRFLEMYCISGDSTLNKKEFKCYFENFFLSQAKTKSRQKKAEALRGSLILCSYLLTNKYTKRNYVGIIEAWTCLLFTILYFGNQWKISKKTISEIEEMILDEISVNYGLLFEDIAKDEKLLVDGEYGILSEGLITFRLRCIQLLGFMMAYLNFSVLKGGDMPTLPKGMIEKVILMSSSKIIAGEVTMSYWINIIVGRFLISKPELATEDLKTLIDNILAEHEDKGEGLVSPYYSLEETTSYILGENDQISESFQGRSYTLWTVVLLLVKLGERDFLNERWAKISHISMEEIFPSEPSDLLLWNIEDGKMVDSFPNPKQSWKNLVSDAGLTYDEFTPDELLNRNYLIPFLILTMPHRVNHKLVLRMVN